MTAQTLPPLPAADAERRTLLQATATAGAVAAAAAADAIAIANRLAAAAEVRLDDRALAGRTARRHLLTLSAPHY